MWWWDSHPKTRSMRQLADATLLRFDNYDEPPPGLARTETPDPIANGIRRLLQMR